MPALLALALLLGHPQAATSSDFADRVTRGRVVEAGPGGADYQRRLWQRLNEPTSAALKQCLRRHAPADKSPFTLVADVLPDGTPSRIEVQPATPVASCMADWFAGAPLPSPPPTAGAYPVEIDFSIVP